MTVSNISSAKCFLYVDSLAIYIASCHVQDSHNVKWDYVRQRVGGTR